MLTSFGVCLIDMPRRLKLSYKKNYERKRQAVKREVSLAPILLAA